MSIKKNVSESDTTKAAAEAEEMTTAESVTETAESVTKNEENVMKATESGTEDKKIETKAMPPEKYAGVKNFVYMGPTLPGGQLKSLGVLIGSYGQVTEYYKETLELYPKAEQLIVPVSKLAVTRDRIKQGGNRTSRAYEEVSAAIKAKGEVK